MSTKIKNCLNCYSHVGVGICEEHRARPDNRSREEKHKDYLTKKYNLSWSNYLQILKDQDNSCAICGIKKTFTNKLVVDHDHRTGKIRGLLCTNCNTALGKLGDSLESILLVVAYLTPKV